MPSTDEQFSTQRLARSSYSSQRRTAPTSCKTFCRYDISDRMFCLICVREYGSLPRTAAAGVRQSVSRTGSCTINRATRTASFTCGTLQPGGLGVGAWTRDERCKRVRMARGPGAATHALASQAWEPTAAAALCPSWRGCGRDGEPLARIYFSFRFPLLADFLFGPDPNTYGICTFLNRREASRQRRRRAEATSRESRDHEFPDTSASSEQPLGQDEGTLHCKPQEQRCCC